MPCCSQQFFVVLSHPTLVEKKKQSFSSLSPLFFFLPFSSNPFGCRPLWKGPKGPNSLFDYYVLVSINQSSIPTTPFARRTAPHPKPKSVTCLPFVRPNTEARCAFDFPCSHPHQQQQQQRRRRRRRRRRAEAAAVSSSLLYFRTQLW